MTRDEKGRFVPGHEKTGGRKPRPTEQQYLEAFKNAVSITDIEAIAIRAVKDAQRGDAQARKFVFDYLVGPPVQKNENNNQNSGEIRIVVERKSSNPA